VNESQAEDLLAELRKTRVEELVVHSASLFASLAYGKLSEEARDLDQARLAIEALKALVALLPEEQRRDLQQVVSNLQLAYADAVEPRR
jgi:ABC-type Fe3+ transport system substrate-binding protein